MNLKFWTWKRLECTCDIGRRKEATTSRRKCAVHGVDR